MTPSKLGFGLDLAGYATGKSAMAAIEAKGSTATAILLKPSPFSLRRDTDQELDAIVEEEARAISLCLELGPVAVDIPIDLQQLPLPKTAQKIWELTLRPIDRHLNAMAPFANRIGAPVARFNAIMNSKNYGSRLQAALGHRLFETYPAASIKNCGIVERRHKSNRERNTEACEKICRELRIEANLSDDDLDAVVCAATAVSPLDDLWDEPLIRAQLPIGYILLKRRPFERISVESVPFTDWLSSRQYQA